VRYCLRNPCILLSCHAHVYRCLHTPCAPPFALLATATLPPHDPCSHNAPHAPHAGNLLCE
jgi:hypothetical protein